MELQMYTTCYVKEKLRDLLCDAMIDVYCFEELRYSAKAFVFS